MRIHATAHAFMMPSPVVMSHAPSFNSTPSFAVGVDDVSRFEGDVRVDSDRVQLAVQRLPQSLRNVVELRLMHGLPHSEIGLRLGLSTNACEVRLCRALKQLRALIGEAA